MMQIFVIKIYNKKYLSDDKTSWYNVDIVPDGVLSDHLHL